MPVIIGKARWSLDQFFCVSDARLEFRNEVVENWGDLDHGVRVGRIGFDKTNGGAEGATAWLFESESFTPTIFFPGGALLMLVSGRIVVSSRKEFSAEPGEGLRELVAGSMELVPSNYYAGLGAEAESELVIVHPGGFKFRVEGE